MAGCCKSFTTQFPKDHANRHVHQGQEQRMRQKNSCKDCNEMGNRHSTETHSTQQSQFMPEQLAASLTLPIDSTLLPSALTIPSSQQQLRQVHCFPSDAKKEHSEAAVTRSCPLLLKNGTTTRRQVGSLASNAQDFDSDIKDSRFLTSTKESGRRHPEKLVSSAPTTPTVSPTDELLYPPFGVQLTTQGMK